MQEAYVLIGGNIGNRIQYLREAIARIGGTCGTVLQQSSVYETAAWGKQDQAAFLNQVIKMATPYSPADLLRKLLLIELEMGRVRKEKYGERTIDIDILYVGMQVVHTPDLTVPHPKLAERRFALVPMAEINAELIDPSTQKSIRHMLNNCSDTLDVQVYIEDVQKI